MIKKSDKESQSAIRIYTSKPWNLVKSGFLVLTWFVLVSFILIYFKNIFF